MEAWRKIGFNKNYEVSDFGNVRSVERFVRIGKSFRLVRGRVLSAWVCKRTGYKQVMISRKKLNVHRLVCEAFLPADMDRKWVNHKNGDRSDCRLDNLEWCSPSENALHCFRVINPDVRPMLGRFSSDHPTSKPVVSVDIRTGEEKVYASASDAVREGFDSGGISKCCSGKSATHKGRSWSFLDKRGAAA